MSTPAAGWLFAYDWDRLALAALQSAGRARFSHAGFDLFSFPSNARLVGFDIEAFAARQAERGRRERWRAVLSHHEQFGALAAALVAERLGLPGAAPEAVLAAQHKLQARRVLQAAAPEANLGFALLDAEYGGRIPEGLAYPTFVKPVKAAFSVLARHVNSQAELVHHTRFPPREGWVIKVCRARLPEAGSAHRLLLEEPVPLDVPQFNLDGYVQDGQVHAVGVVDAVTIPGTQAFIRWELPSRLPASVQARALAVARRFLQALGYRHGFFNLEFFYDATNDRLAVIELNPRLASQFSDLHRRVLGVDAHAQALALALGEDAAAVPRGEPTAAAAASLVYRVLPGEHVPAAPRRAARAAFARAHPQGLCLAMPKSGHSLQRDFKWTGSHRYGVVHLGAADRSALRRAAEHASALLGWPSPYRSAIGATGATGATGAAGAGAPGSVREAALDQAHVGAGHDGLDVYEDQHALGVTALDRAQTGDGAGVNVAVELGRGADLPRVQLQHVAD
jgi:hypothetical protein